MKIQVCISLYGVLLELLMSSGTSHSKRQRVCVTLVRFSFSLFLFMTPTNIYSSNLMSLCNSNNHLKLALGGTIVELHVDPLITHYISCISAYASLGALFQAPAHKLLKTFNSSTMFWGPCPYFFFLILKGYSMI